LVFVYDPELERYRLEISSRREFRLRFPAGKEKE